MSDWFEGLAKPRWRPGIAVKCEFPACGVPPVQWWTERRPNRLQTTGFCRSHARTSEAPGFLLGPLDRGEVEALSVLMM